MLNLTKEDAMKKPRAPHERIVVGLPNLQDQLRLVDRLCGGADEPELTRWSDLAKLLADLYSQLQHQKQVTVYRFGQRGHLKTAGDSKSR